MYIYDIISLNSS